MRRPAAAIAMAVWTLLAYPSAGLAETHVGPGPCVDADTDNNNQWAGQKNESANGRHGARANYEAWVLVMCTNPGLVEISGSYVFANVGPNDGGFNDIIQIGAGHSRCPVACPSGMHYFSGMGLTHTTPGCSGYQDVAPLLLDEGAWTNQQHQYMVKHSGNLWRLYVDGVQEGFSLAESGVCWTPRMSFWMGETLDRGDQLGGTFGDRLRISTTQYMSSEGGAWLNTSFNASNQCNYAATNIPYFCDIIGLQSIEIWTDR